MGVLVMSGSANQEKARSVTASNSSQDISVANVVLPVRVAGNGRPLLFLNGGDAFHRSGDWFDALAKRYRVFAPKYPGFSGSPLAGHIRNVGHLALLCRELIDKLDLDDVVLVGASFGGWVALELAVGSCDRISRLVLIDTLGVKFGGETDDEIADIYTLKPDDLKARRYHVQAKIPDYSHFDQQDLVEIAEDWAGESFYGWKPYMHTPGLKEWLWRVRVPTLVLWGEHDGIVSPSYGQRVAAEIPNAAFDIVKQAAHYPHVEQPLDTFSKMEAFLGAAPA